MLGSTTIESYSLVNFLVSSSMFRYSYGEREVKGMCRSVLDWVEAMEVIFQLEE